MQQVAFLVKIVDERLLFVSYEYIWLHQKLASPVVLSEVAHSGKLHFLRILRDPFHALDSVLKKHRCLFGHFEVLNDA